MHLPSALLVTAAAAMVFEPAENDNAPAVQGIREEAAAAFAAPIDGDDDVVDFQKRQAAKQGSGEKKNGGNKNGGNKNGGNKNGGNKNGGNKNGGNKNGGNKNSGNKNSGNKNSGNKNGGKKGNSKKENPDTKKNGDQKKKQGNGKGKNGQGKKGKDATGKPTKPDTSTDPAVEGVSDTSDIGLLISENPTIVGSSFPSEFTINVGTEAWIAKKASIPQIAVLSKRSVNQKNEGFVANPFAALATLLMGGLMFLL